MALVLSQGKGDPIREQFLLGAVDRLGGLLVIAPARRAGDPGSIPVQVRIFSLKLLLLIIIIIIIIIMLYIANTARGMMRKGI